MSNFTKKMAGIIISAVLILAAVCGAASSAPLLTLFAAQEGSEEAQEMNEPDVSGEQTDLQEPDGLS